LRAIIGTLAMGGAMNALSFGEHAQGLMLWRAIGLGLAIPALVYARTRAGDGEMGSTSGLLNSKFFRKEEVDEEFVQHPVTNDIQILRRDSVSRRNRPRQEIPVHVAD
jgi:hypothetical protein